MGSPSFPAPELLWILENEIALSSPNKILSIIFIAFCAASLYLFYHASLSLI
jgi:hypothetical protein